MEQFKEKERDTNKLLIIILGFSTMIVALVGATFAYFTAVVNKVNGDQSVLITTQTIEGVTYEASSALVLPGALPGDSANSSYTIHNPNASADAIYKMELVTDINDFETTQGTGQLLLTISGGQLEDDVVLDLTDGGNKDKKLIQDNIRLKAGQTDTYTTHIEFAETGRAQDTNRAKNFSGHIEVTQTMITITAE